MKTALFFRSAFSLAFILAVVGPSHAMSPGTLNAEEHTRYALGADFIAQSPVGDFGDVAGFGVGGLLRYEHHLARSPLALTARGGYIWHMEQETGAVTSNLSQVPLLAGFKYSLSGAPVYVGADAGVSVRMIDTEGPGVDESDTETTFAWSAGAGYELGPVDIRLAFYFADGVKMSESMSVGVSLGYNFMGK
jgi:opacity protein-like surface antigen